MREHRAAVPSRRSVTDRFVNIWQAELLRGVELSGVTIRDSGDNISGGRVAGFVVEAITLSRKLLNNADLRGPLLTSGPNSYNALAARIADGAAGLSDVSSCTQDRVSVTPGAVRSVDSATALDRLCGAKLVYFPAASLGFDAQDGHVSLGDDGKMKFDFTSPVSASEDAPIFLYVSEWTTVDLDGTVRWDGAT